MSNSGQDIKIIKDLSTKEFEDKYLVFKKNRLYSFLGGAIVFLVAAGLVSYKGALEAIETTGAERALERLNTIVDIAATDSARISGMFLIEDIENALVPVGTVAAFDLANCPNGWSEFKNAQGRFIVGVGQGNYDQNQKLLKERALGQSGGEEEHILSTEEIPSHFHSHPFTGESTIEVQDGTGKIVSRVNVHNGSGTGSIGSGIAHNNMPPFIALSYCIKE